MKNCEGSVSALLVGEYSQDAKVVWDVFGRCGWHLRQMVSRAQAVAYARRHVVQVVIAQSTAWQSMLDELRALPNPPQLVVTSRTADDYLWSAVLNHGGFDVLPQPFDRDELQRVIAAAARRASSPPLQATAGKVA